eukprot:CCRYP_009201-RD/>CCRYP_009201-RD protein AED:0.20 eAED:0.20 QI:895/0.5/0.66/1/0.5/0.33/3/0/236
MSPSTGCKEAEAVSIDEDSVTARRKCTTFIVLCPPRTFVHLCHLAPNQSISTTDDEVDEKSGNIGGRMPITSWSQVEIESDIQPWSLHENVNDEHSTLIHFPFCDMQASIHNEDTTNERRQCYQCIQSENGQLTHFFHGNYHAIDFACPIGTPLYSPVDGVVININDNSNHGGDTAFDNRTLESGSVGFSPTPHLHLGAYRSSDDGAESVRVRFECAGEMNGRETGVDGKTYSFYL